MAYHNDRNLTDAGREFRERLHKMVHDYEQQSSVGQIPMDPGPIMYPTPITKVPSMLSASEEQARAMDVLAFRLKGNSFVYSFEHISLHMSEKTTFIFIVKGGQAVILEDEVEMFPSDKLVAAIKLLIG